MAGRADIELALLRNQVLDFGDSDDEYERLLGRLLNEQTNPLDGEDFAAAVREILAGLTEAMDRFHHEWDLIR